jgi:hypothetical protein
MRKSAFGVAVIVGCLMATIGLAGPPERVSWSLTGEGVSFVVPAPDLCEFDVTVTVLVLEAEETYHYDREHQLLRVQTHITQQDAFTNEVSGKTLTGEVYAATVEADFERNETWATGVFEKVRLPDGSWFLLAGRVQLLQETLMILAPDHGTVKGVEGFCAALR